ncbi:hypothetical protein DW322_06995 [Rhodococcus rhodnii]|uniref:DUF6802 domain-containing protein n=1 Tax=Rhodococcus rhodnii TaxID=38312 RepID=A0A6P2CJJ6_9NOCA|nr:DUF6802 family protein [Rhodococcus rhodnii]TXG92492.1 hypothetical protein DW322_06995 [Rhodococcus rhodnii]
MVAEDPTTSVSGVDLDVELDARSFGPESGSVALTSLTHDLDGDGIFDTYVRADGDGTVIATDLDGDGDADRVTFLDASGEYDAWEFRVDDDGNPTWDRIDDGLLGDS